MLSRIPNLFFAQCLPLYYDPKSETGHFIEEEELAGSVQSMETFDFRLADENDLDFIRRLSVRVFSKYGAYDEIVLGWLLEAEVITVIIEAGAEPLGFAMVTLEREKWFEPRRGLLLAIGVFPEQQRKGIGTALLAHMEEVARKYGIEEMFLSTAVDNQQALSFFQNAGFHIVGSEDRYYPRGQAALTLSKKLSR